MLKTKEIFKTYLFYCCERHWLYSNRECMSLVESWGRGELNYLEPLDSENISAPYFKQCFFRRGGGYYPPDSQAPRLPVSRQK